MLSFFGRFLSIIDKWRGKSVDFDKVYGSQCVDWVKQFTKEQYGIILGTFSGSAINAWMTGSPFDKQWVRVNYKPNLYPEIGDVVFFASTLKNPYGHVCIADNNCNTYNLCIIEQNAGSGNGDGKKNNAIAQRVITYKDRGGCVGWYHKK